MSIKALTCILRRDLKILIYKKSEWIMPVLYFVLIASLFPIAIDPEPDSLKKLAPGIVWIAIVLSLLMSLENIFRLDYQAGAIEYLVLSPYPLSILLLGKCLAQWLAIGLPLLLLTPLVGSLLQLSFLSIGVLCVTLLLGIPIISLIGSLGVTLTLGLHRSSILLAILILPLLMPVIIFAVSAVSKASQGLPYYAELFMLSALLVFSLGTIPLLLSFTVKMSIE